MRSIPSSMFTNTYIRAMIVRKSMWGTPLLLNLKTNSTTLWMPDMCQLQKLAGGCCLFLRMQSFLLAKDWTFICLLGISSFTKNMQMIILWKDISTEMYEHRLLDLNDIRADYRFDLKTMDGFKDVFPNTDTRANANTNHSNTYERMHAQLYVGALESDDPDQLPFNESQSAVYNVIKQSAFLESPEGQRVFFVDGPGGTGKTFVFNALLGCVRQENEVAIALKMWTNCLLNVQDTFGSQQQHNV
ncbi:hypothetical protein PS15m_011925 [Mucor circinelloides]